MENRTRRILLHCCCGPCATSSIERLLEEGWEVVLYYGNSNIFPQKENEDRYQEFLKVASHYRLETVRGTWNHQSWLGFIKGLEDCPEHGERCRKCFYFNLRETSCAAQRLGIENFTTTLTVSRFKKSSDIFSAGEAFPGFVPIDFKKRNGFGRSVALGREMGLARQNYCGCEFSARPRKEDGMQEIYIRRSVREFDGRKVEPDKLRRILAAAMQAPSARNQRPWRFVTTDDRDQLLALSKASPHSRLVANAPLAIAVLCDMASLSAPDHWQQDLGACTENLLLEACHLGLGACWMGIAPDKERMDGISRVFGLPPTIAPFSLVAVGYPAKGKGNVFLDRFDPSLIHTGRW